MRLARPAEHPQGDGRIQPLPGAFTLHQTSAIPEPAATIAAPDGAPPEAPAEVGCDLPGVLRVVVRNADSKGVRIVARDIGPPTLLSPSALRPPPTLEISFVDGISTSELRLLDGGAIGYAGAVVYALGRRGFPEASIEQDSLWGTGAITCTRQVRRIPFLSAAVDLAALACDWAPLHASAWVTPEGVGVLASGWAHSGKTGALLAAYEHGSRPIGDDRILLSADGRVMHGLGRPVGVKDWHIAQLPRLRGRIGSTRRALSRAGYAVASRRREGSHSRRGSVVARVLTKARGLSSMEMDLASTTERADGDLRARPDVLLLMEVHDEDRIETEPVPPAMVAARLAAHTRGELIQVLRAQLAYDYVHPGTGWCHVDRAPEMATRILERATANLPTWIVRHPYPCSLARMYTVTSEIVTSVA